MARAQVPRQLHAGELSHALQRLGVVGSVLYVAAHPDDENTRLLAWLVGARGLRAGYLSLTRGDGGQNLIGAEQDALLGLIRTEELLAARRIDGAEQWFTRARDFGYSKSADETLRLWNRELVLSDVVLAIRRFRPDIVVTRFTTKPPNHGHHTASALLAEEAFTAAADPKRFPDQLQGGVTVWKADRLLHNVSTWNLPPNADLSAYLAVDVGGFDPRLGRSWGEVAAESRSQHKSQGFGVPAERGPLPEYFQPLAGTRPKAPPFEGEWTWRRFPGAEKVQAAVDTAVRSFQAEAPHASLPLLLKVRAALAELPDSNPWKVLKVKEVEELVAQCLGLHVEARAPEATVVPGAKVKVEAIAVNRSPVKVEWRSASVRMTDGGAGRVQGTSHGEVLTAHVPVRKSMELEVPADAPISTPYWLRKPATFGVYELEAQDADLIGRPRGRPALTASFTYEVLGQSFTAERPVVFVWTDPVRGERSREVEVTPWVSATLEREVVLFPNASPKTLGVTLAAGREKVAGKVRLELPKGWTAKPEEVPFELASKADERGVEFRVTPPKGAHGREPVRVLVQLDGRTESWRVRSVSHDHIPPLTVREPSQGILAAFPLAITAKKVGYVPGPGDRVAESLQAAGYEVTLLPDERLANEPLQSYAAILVGVRAFNANARLAVHRERLMRYVEQGGNLVVQYNTNSRVGPLSISIGPYPLEIGRERITDESAAMTPVDPHEPLLLHPNRLDRTDFEGWIQERGLYFATTWDERYRPVFSMQDPAEEPLRGGLLVARFGKGTFVYTGLSFFRQLPAGVPGAYRLLANLLAL